MGFTSLGAIPARILPFKPPSYHFGWLQSYHFGPHPIMLSLLCSALVCATRPRQAKTG